MKVVAVQALYDYMLWVKFDTDEEKIFDCKPMFALREFARLQDPALFEQAAVDNGGVSWLDGAARIYASFLHDNGL